MRFRKTKRWLNRRFQLAGFAPLFLSACSQCTPLPPPDIEPIQEPLPVTSSATSSPGTSTTGAPVATCETACANQLALGCEIGQPTPEGHDCVAVCQNLEDGPIVSIRWDLACLSAATDCDEC